MAPIRGSSGSQVPLCSFPFSSKVHQTVPFPFLSGFQFAAPGFPFKASMLTDRQRCTFANRVAFLFSAVRPAMRPSCLCWSARLTSSVAGINPFRLAVARSQAPFAACPRSASDLAALQAHGQTKSRARWRQRYFVASRSAWYVKRSVVRPTDASNYGCKRSSSRSIPTVPGPDNVLRNACIPIRRHVRAGRQDLYHSASLPAHQGVR